MNSGINIEQAIHGYSNGHQLLAASMELELENKKIIDELSDLSGRCDADSFVAYFTGYPLNEGKQYVIAKTWYANEMKRPGCVWTHSLIFNTEDIQRIRDIDALMALFQRPSPNDLSAYKRRILLNVGPQKEILNYDTRKLQYLLYTIFSSNSPRYVPLYGATNFDFELFVILTQIPCGILEKFSFCTMSYDVRRIKDSEFAYQMGIEKNVYRFIRETNDRYLCESYEDIKEYPYWVKCYERDMAEELQEGVITFAKQFGKEYIDYVNYSCMARLFFAVRNKEYISLLEYMKYVDLAMLSQNLDIYQKTIDLILEGKFYPSVFHEQEYEILEVMDLKEIELDKKHENLLDEKVIQNAPDKLYRILKKYISGKLKKKGKVSVERIIKKLEPENLKEVSNMDENICVVLVHMNGSLIASKDIWTQPKSFQQMMLSMSSENVESKVVTCMLAAILKYDKENIAEDVFTAYGEKIISNIYSVLSTEKGITRENVQYWYSILLKNPILLLKNIDKIPYRQCREQLFLQINTYTDEIIYGIDKAIWRNLYIYFMENEKNEKNKVKYAVQFFPVVIKKIDVFEEMNAKRIIKIVYEELKNDTMEFDDWNKMQVVLPQVEPYYAWDKCLRVRKALENMGYSLSIVE